MAGFEQSCQELAQQSGEPDFGPTWVLVQMQGSQAQQAELSLNLVLLSPKVPFQGTCSCDASVLGAHREMLYFDFQKSSALSFLKQGRSPGVYLSSFLVVFQGILLSSQQKPVRCVKWKPHPWIWDLSHFSPESYSPQLQKIQKKELS